MTEESYELVTPGGTPEELARLVERSLGFLRDLNGKDLEQLFQPYQFTLSDDAGQRASLGLELATCRKIAEYANGSVHGFFNARGELGFAAEVGVTLAKTEVAPP